MDVNELINRVRFHGADTEEKRAAHQRLREVFIENIQVLNRLVPDGREKSLMFTHFEDAQMWGHKALAISMDAPDDETVWDQHDFGKNDISVEETFGSEGTTKR